MKKNVHFEQRLTNRSYVANELLSKDESIGLNQFIKIFRIKYTRECIFSYYQMNKIYEIVTECNILEISGFLD